MGQPDQDATEAAERAGVENAIENSGPTTTASEPEVYSPSVAEDAPANSDDVEETTTPDE